MNRYLSAIFCDDVRFEVGNKFSYIGCYTGQMAVPLFPIILPKLCVVMMAHTIATDRFKNLTFRVMKNDDVIGESVLPLESVLESFVLPMTEGEELRQTVSQIVQLFPLQIDAPCKFRARVITETGEELRGGSLMVSLADPPPA